MVSAHEKWLRIPVHIRSLRPCGAVNVRPAGPSFRGDLPLPEPILPPCRPKGAWRNPVKPCVALGVSFAFRNDRPPPTRPSFRYPELHR